MPLTHSPLRRTILLTAIAMLAFAGNSLLCRLALAGGHIDPAGFTLIRLASGAVMLAVLAGFGRSARRLSGSWPAAAALLAYAAAFSFAYVQLPAGTGAFLLFAAVQATMIAAGLARGERLTGLQWLGSALALAGLAILAAPGADAPPPLSALLMIISGVAWGAYSLLGRGTVDALGATAGNFLRALPLAMVVLLPGLLSIPLPGMIGVICAVLSGALASGVGYAIWYAALPGLTPAQGASVQLSVPVITAIIGAAALAEPVTWRLGLSSVTILGGIALVIGMRRAAR
mgnify:CR=1 FL=1